METKEKEEDSKLDKRKRDRTSTKLPTTVDPKNVEVLKLIYSEVNSNYRNLADIRFKLLGFVPVVSIIAWAELVSTVNPINLQNSILGIIISLLSIRVLFGISIYDKRNDELYNDLVSRGRKIEEELDVDTAIFKGRLQPNLKDKIFNKEINHGRGLGLIYSSVFTGWVLLASWYMYKLIILLFSIQ